MKKTLITILATVLVCCCAVGGTLAWLMDETESVVNTFTVGDVDIELIEDGAVDGAQSFKMIPGTTVEKDPYVTVSSDSEDCWVFVSIEESASLADFITYDVDDAVWVEVEEDVWATKVKQSANAELHLFSTGEVSVKTSVTKDMMDKVEAGTTVQPTLTFTAYAIQAEGFDTYTAAWSQVKTDLSLT